MERAVHTEERLFMPYFKRVKSRVRKELVPLELRDCILRHPTADFAEQNGRNAKLIGHRPLPL